ncbi:MAG: hypothetical protein JW839_03515 [Candidatus Lokiarchaeota archaeon]|nr:hypothetical protein [Candidatus Lokiarchaeota archaeon]
MEHYLARIVSAKGADLSTTKPVHNRFVRYSKGTFEGPTAKISRKGKSITVKAGLDYENILGLLVLSAIKSGSVSVEGNITAFEDPRPVMGEVIPASKQDQVMMDEKKNNWILDFTGDWTKAELNKIYDVFDQRRGYILLSLSDSGDTTASFKVNPKVPRPKKGAGKGDQEENETDKIAKAIKFSTAKFLNDAGTLAAIIDSMLPDMKKEAANFKEATIENAYTISDIAIPASAVDKRLAAVRKGILTRKITIDGTRKSIQYPFVV